MRPVINLKIQTGGGIIKIVPLFAFCLLISCSEKEDLTEYTSSCVECSKHNPVSVIDTCGSIQDMQAFIIEMQRKAYTCQTKKVW